MIDVSWFISIGFVDSDYVGDIEDSKSTSGYVFMMSEEPVAWFLISSL